MRGLMFDDLFDDCIAAIKPQTPTALCHFVLPNRLNIAYDKSVLQRLHERLIVQCHMG